LRKQIVVKPGQGRTYDMGRIKAIFKADNEETSNQYSVSEWWLDANTKGPGIHTHDEDDVFYVLEGTMSFFVGDQWQDE
jgi:mannose-6-phosphate isomerase-like protein (cupin superfamily)